MKIRHVIQLLFFTTASVANSAIQVLNGYQITYYSTYASEAPMTPADLAVYQAQFPDGQWSVFNQLFINDYLSLSAMYGGDSLIGGSRIFAHWDDGANTRLRAAIDFGYDMDPFLLNDGRFATLVNISQTWLDAINASPSLQQTYQFERATEAYIMNNAIPEPSCHLLVSIGCALVITRRLRIRPTT